MCGCLWDGGSPLCQTCQSAGEFEKYRAGPHCQQRHRSLWGRGPTVSVSTTLCFWISGGSNVQPSLRGAAVNIRDTHCPPPARLTLNTLGFSGDTGCREVSFLSGAGTWAGCSLCLPKGQAELPAARTAPTTTKATLALLLAREAPWLIPRASMGKAGQELGEGTSCGRSWKPLSFIPLGRDHGNCGGWCLVGTLQEAPGRRQECRLQLHH